MKFKLRYLNCFEYSLKSEVCLNLPFTIFMLKCWVVNSHFFVKAYLCNLKIHKFIEYGQRSTVGITDFIVFLFVIML